MRPRCSAVSRVPFGGSAALDTASAPRPDQRLSTALKTMASEQLYDVRDQSYRHPTRNTCQRNGAFKSIEDVREAGASGGRDASFTKATR